MMRYRCIDRPMGKAVSSVQQLKAVAAFIAAGQRSALRILRGLGDGR